MGKCECGHTDDSHVVGQFDCYVCRGTCSTFTFDKVCEKCNHPDSRHERIASDDPNECYCCTLTVAYKATEAEVRQRIADEETVIEGVGKNVVVVENEVGARQSAVSYRLDIIPPRALLAVGRVFKEGADKYGVDNWHGIPVSDHLNHALIHIFAERAGDIQDDHLEHAACRLLMALEIHLRNKRKQTKG